MAGRWGYAVLLVLVVGLLGYLIDHNPAPTPTDNPVAFYPLFPEITSQIIGLELIIPSESFAIRVVNEGENQWRLGADPFSPVDPNAPAYASLHLAAMEGLGKRAQNELSEESLGLLPNPQYVIRFQLDDLRVVELQVGNRTPSDNAYYVVIDQNSVIVDVVEAFWIDEIVTAMLSIEPLETQADSTPTPVP